MRFEDDHRALSPRRPDAHQRTAANVGVLGLGYVGLPLIRTFVAAGFRTLGFDVDEAKVKAWAQRRGKAVQLTPELKAIIGKSDAAAVDRWFKMLP